MNGYNSNFYSVDKLLQYRNEIDELIKNKQQQPMNIFNVGGNQVEFEARIISKNENPDEIMVQRRTAFISFENAKLTIKEVNGDMKEYEIVIPKTPEQIENEQLHKRIAELELQLKERDDSCEHESTSATSKEQKSSADVA